MDKTLPVKSETKQTDNPPKEKESAKMEGEIEELPAFDLALLQGCGDSGRLA